jgi:hypothetical protein
MNRKILDAFERAGGNVRLIDGAIWTYTDNGFDPKKFAEQIVRNCISEVAMMGVVHYDNPDIAWTVDTIIGNLKETFEIK